MVWCRRCIWWLPQRLCPPVPEPKRSLRRRRCSRLFRKFWERSHGRGSLGSFSFYFTSRSVKNIGGVSIHEDGACINFTALKKPTTTFSCISFTPKVIASIEDDEVPAHDSQTPFNISVTTLTEIFWNGSNFTRIYVERKTPKNWQQRIRHQKSLKPRTSLSVSILGGFNVIFLKQGFLLYRCTKLAPETTKKQI